MAKFTIDTDEIANLARHGSEFALDPEAEKSLARLLFLKDKIDELLETVGNKIEENALSLDSNFTGLRGDNIKIEYRAYGAEYKITDPNLVDDIFKTKKVTYALKTPIVKDYVETKGVIPTGVERVERPKRITIKNIKKGD